MGIEEGKTVVLTSVTKGVADPNVNVAGFFGVIDYMRENQVSMILAPALSPFINLRQQREYRDQGKFSSYNDHWFDVDPESGVSTDPQRLFLLFFGFEQGPVVENFMEIPVSMKEVLMMLANERRINQLSPDEIVSLLSEGYLFFRDLPVPLQNIGVNSYRAIVPAAWMIKKNDFDEDQIGQGPILYRPYRRPFS